MSWKWKMTPELERNWLVVLKLTWGIWRVLTLARRSLKTLHFNGFLVTKYIMFELKKYRGVIFHDTKRWCKVWRKTELWFEKWNEKFGKFPPEDLKVSKLEIWCNPFVQSRKCMSLKFTKELCVMTMRNDAKFEEELTFISKLAWEIVWILTRALKNLKTLLLNWLHRP